MPQMFPSNWMFFMLFFIMIYFMFNMFIYFNFIKTNFSLKENLKKIIENDNKPMFLQDLRIWYFFCLQLFPYEFLL